MYQPEKTDLPGAAVGLCGRAPSLSLQIRKSFLSGRFYRRFLFRLFCRRRPATSIVVAVVLEHRGNPYFFGYFAICLHILSLMAYWVKILLRSQIVLVITENFKKLKR